MRRTAGIAIETCGGDEVETGVDEVIRVRGQDVNVACGRIDPDMNELVMVFVAKFCKNEWIRGIFSEGEVHNRSKAKEDQK